MKKIVTAFMLSFLLICTVCSTSAASSQTTKTAAEKRLEELDFFCSTLEKSHKNLYANITKKQFMKEKQNIAKQLPKMSDSDYYYSLKHLLALVGDGHTDLSYYDSQYKHISGLGFAIAKYNDGWHLMMLEEKNKSYLGYQLTAINQMDISDIFQKAKSIMSFENEAWAQMQFSNTINFREALEYLKVIKKGAPITLQIKKDDKSPVKTLRISSMNEQELLNAEILTMLPKKQSATMPSGIYNAKTLNNNTYFIQYNSCQEDPNLPMSKFVSSVSKEIQANPYKKIIIDLRYNSGGNSSVFEPMIKELKKLQKKSSFKVYTLIGGRTFSSGIINALQIKESLGGTFVGSPTGGNVNGYGELKSFQLPETPIMVWYSTKYFELWKGYKKDSIYPDIKIPQRFDDYVNGIDREVNAVLKLK